MTLPLPGRRAAVVTIDLHRGHLDPEVATMPLPADAAARVTKANAEFLREARNRRARGARRHLLPVAAEIASNPWWAAVADTDASRANALRHQLPGSPGLELMPEVYEPDYDLVVTSKKRYDCFMATDLDHVLRSRGIDTLLLTGVNTNSCVLATTVAANTRDYARSWSRTASTPWTGPFTTPRWPSSGRPSAGWPPHRKFCSAGGYEGCRHSRPRDPAGAGRRDARRQAPGRHPMRSEDGIALGGAPAGLPLPAARRRSTTCRCPADAMDARASTSPPVRRAAAVPVLDRSGRSRRGRPDRSTTRLPAWCGRRPTRFARLATLPLQDPACRGRRAAALRGHSGFRGAADRARTPRASPLDDAALRPVLAAAAELGVPAEWCTPTTSAPRPAVDDFYLTNLQGNPWQTAVCASRLILSGTLDELPGLDLVLVHGGGHLPYQMGRLDHGLPRCARRPGLPRRRRAHYLRRFHYDTLTHAQRRPAG